MTSQAANEEERAAEAYADEAPHAALLHALSAIRHELRTANLIAFAGISIALATPGEFETVRTEIREELDIEGTS